MNFEAILFDLDGTLLPMDYNTFTKGYLDLLSSAVAPYGYKKDTLLPAMWNGVSSMINNNGSRPNSAAFWETFSQILGNKVYDDIPFFDDFYSNDFNRAVVFTSPSPNARKAVDIAKTKAKHVVLATNPLFPACAVKSRLGWTMLEMDDFDLVTDYDNSSYCKPNPDYYLEITSKLGVNPENCLMIGNNADEDIKAAQSAGLSTFLLTDCLITEGELPKTASGSSDELIAYLESL